MRKLSSENKTKAVTMRVRVSVIERFRAAAKEWRLEEHPGLFFAVVFEQWEALTKKKLEEQQSPSVRVARHVSVKPLGDSELDLQRHPRKA